jgi:hypothetical protein
MRREYAEARVRGGASTRRREYAEARVRGGASTRRREYAEARVRGYAEAPSAGVQLIGQNESARAMIPPADHPQARATLRVYGCL